MRTITSRQLNKNYDKYAAIVLNDYLESLPHERKRGSSRTYKLLKLLPTKEAYFELKIKKYTTTIQDLVSDAFSEFESLSSELQEWYDNLPEQFQNGDKGTTLQESSDTLSNLDIPDVSEEAGKIAVVFYPSLESNSRSSRCNEACDMLRTAMDVLREESENEELSEEHREEMTELADSLESVIDCAEGVEFPGMFG